ncbi:FdhF/YdeP family oxidoreductase [Oscillatoria sp. FACHB-1406]|nr:FdhF/YdeP family oxidoreductase [Oscillatoria sp. FACHB-1406]
MTSDSSQHSHTPSMGGGPYIIKYWADKTLSPDGPQLWKTLLHKSACLSCAWGTGGQKGGFHNEADESLQRCMKSVESIVSELQPPVEPHFFDTHSLSELQQLTSYQCDRLGRFSFPVIHRAGSSHYERISYREIYRLAETTFRSEPERVASYSSGRSSNEAAYLLQLMIRALGSNNLADCSDLCHVASTVGLTEIFGSGTSMVSLEGLKKADCVVIAGSNAAYNHPRLMNELIKLRDRGGKVIVINPIREIGMVRFGSPAFPVKSLFTGSDIASLYLQPIPGSDVALFVGLQKAALEAGTVKTDFLQSYTENWEAVLDYARNTPWETITATCGVARADIEAAAAIISASKGVVFAWAMGITQHVNGVDNVYSIANTALLTGNAGKEGAGTMPIRGHSNVQGFGSMGVTSLIKEEILTALEKLFGRSLSRVPGYNARALIDAAEAQKIDALLCVGGNLFAANPDSEQARRALSSIDTIIYLSTKPNLGHFHGLAGKNTIIVPVFNRFENPHKTTTESGNNFVRLNDTGSTHIQEGELISEVEFLTEMAHRLLGDYPVNWRKLQDTQYVRELIAKTIPGYEKIGEIDRTEEEFTIGGRIFTQPKFKTASGKAKMSVTPLPQLDLPDIASFGAGEVRGKVVALTTGRSYSQHNTVVYKEGDRYRKMPHRHCILMNPEDCDRAGFSEHQRVTVRADAGELDNIEIIYGDVREGAALMFYPEVNAILKARIDPHCGIPAYKRVPALIYIKGSGNN